MLANSIFSGNSARSGGGLAYWGSGGQQTSIVGCSFFGNIALTTGGGFLGDFSANPLISNSIFWGNTDSTGSGSSAQIGFAGGGGATATVNYSCVDGGWPGPGGVGNTSSNPLFLDPDGSDNAVGTADDDLRLSVASSPCVDSGDNNAVVPDVADLDGDGDTSEPTPVDVTGLPRFFDEVTKPDTGSGTPPIVDMGAHEFRPIDCNGNGIHDYNDIASGSSGDCNGNNIPDECGITSGESLDCNANGTPDECEPRNDCQPNGIQDICDIALGTSQDCLPNGVPDECELVGNDCDGNSMPDECDLDCNSNGAPDACETFVDCNNNSVPDECELGGNDCNGSGIPDECELAGNDCNLNDVPDECDPDCNLNGIPDNCEAYADCNNNGSPDDCELVGNDCNSTGIPDDCELVGNDCDGNSMPDECDLDCNSNGAPDACETFVDCNSTGVPDECEIVGNDCDGNLVPDDCDAVDVYGAISGPTDVLLCQGDTAMFSVSTPFAAGYQWYKGGAPLAAGGGISGVDTDTLAIQNTSSGDVDAYYCAVSDGCIVANSDSALLRLRPETLAVTEEPVAQSTVCTASGQSALFQMNVDDPASVTYQWYHDGVPVVDDGRISGAQTNRLVIGIVETGDLGFYACHAENACGGSADTDAARGELLVVDAIYSEQPQSVCTSVGGSAAFNVTVASPPGVMLFWFRDGVQLSNGTDGNGMVIAGATSETLQLSKVPAAYDGSVFYVTGFYPNPTCFSDSDLATLTVGYCSQCVTAGDMDLDGDVDLADMHAFMLCFGQAATPGSPCECADVAGADGLVDLNDWASLALTVTGP